MPVDIAPIVSFENAWSRVFALSTGLDWVKFEKSICGKVPKWVNGHAAMMPPIENLSAENDPFTGWKQHTKLLTKDMVKQSMLSLSLIQRKINLGEPMFLARTFPNLTKINLSGNQLAHIHTNTFPSSLIELNLSVNCLTSVPNVSQCPNLAHVNLGYNQINAVETLINEQLPLSICSLDLGFNRLVSLSSTVINVKPFLNMKLLCFQGNPFALSTNYRAVVATCLPQIDMLDDVAISACERSKPLDITEENILLPARLKLIIGNVYGIQSPPDIQFLKHIKDTSPAGLTIEYSVEFGPLKTKHVQVLDPIPQQPQKPPIVKPVKGGHKEQPPKLLDSVVGDESASVLPGALVPINQIQDWVTVCDVALRDQLHVPIPLKVIRHMMVRENHLPPVLTPVPKPTNAQKTSSRQRVGSAKPASRPASSYVISNTKVNDKTDTQAVTDALPDNTVCEAHTLAEWQLDVSELLYGENAVVLFPAACADFMGETKCPIALEFGLFLERSDVLFDSISAQSLILEFSRIRKK